MGYEQLCVLKGWDKSLSSVAFSPDGAWLAVSSAEEDIRVFAVPSFEEVASFVGHTAGVSVVTFSPSSKLLASASDDDTVRIWQIDDDLVASRAADALSLGVPGRFGPLSTLIGHTGPVYCAAWGPRGDIIASGSVDEMIRLWDVQRGKCIRVIPAHADPVTSVHFNLNGSAVASASWDGYIRIWEFATGQCLKTLVDADNTPVSHVLFSPNARYVFASTLDSTLRLWHTTEGDKPVKVYKGHVNRKYCIPASLLPGNQQLLVGSENGKLVIFDIQTRSIAHEVEAHGDVVIAAACHPTLPLLASASLEKDRTVRIWQRRD